MAHLGVKEKSDIHRIPGTFKSLITPGSYGDATHSVTVTVNKLGVITSIVSVPISASGGGGESWHPFLLMGGGG